MFALIAAVGTPAFQLPAANQSGDTAPVQLVWACVETVDAVNSTIAASNPDDTDLKPARVGDIAQCQGRIENSRYGSRLIPAPNQSAMPIIKMGRYGSGIAEMRERVKF
jgi:hypothetical protein